MRNITMVATLLLAAVGAVNAQTTVGGQFTYQGELKSIGAPVNDSADFRFTLWDTVASGTQIGSVFEVNGVTVAEGRFTVGLDFGVAAFDGDKRWLEIEVRSPAGVGDFSTLSPRQLITASPYSIQTRGIFVNDAGHIGIGTTNPQRELDVEAEAPAFRLTATDPTPGVAGRLQFRGSAGPPIFHSLGVIEFYNDLDELLATIRSITAGPSAARMDFSVSPDGVAQLSVATNLIRARDTLELFRGSDLETAASIGSDGADSFFQIQGGNLGIGTAAPNSKLHVHDQGSNRAIYGETVDGFYAIEGKNTNPDGVAGVVGRADYIGVYGIASGATGFATGVLGMATQSGPLNYGVQGESFSPSGYDFFASGAGQDYGSSSSRRWKSDVREIEQPLNKLSHLRGVYFTWDKEHGGHHDVGMIAEEVGEVLPEIVSYEENGIDAIGMDYSKLTPLLVEAVNALRKENSLLRDRVTSIERRLNEASYSSRED